MSGPAAAPLFRSVHRLTLGLVALLVVDMGLAWVALQAGFLFIELVWRALAAPTDYGALLQAHVSQFRGLRVAQAVGWGASAVVFLRWLYRVECTLLALGAGGLQYCPRSAVMAFVIPVVNLVRPLAVMREIWTATDPSAPRAARPTGRTPARLTAWWASVVIAAVADVGARTLACRGGTSLDVGLAMQVLLVGQGAALAASALTIAVTVAVDGRLTQPARARHTPRAGRAD